MIRRRLPPTRMPATPTQLTDCTATELLALYRSGAASPVEATQALAIYRTEYLEHDGEAMLGISEGRTRIAQRVDRRHEVAQALRAVLQLQCFALLLQLAAQLQQHRHSRGIAFAQGAGVQHRDRPGLRQQRAAHLGQRRHSLLQRQTLGQARALVGHGRHPQPALAVAPALLRWTSEAISPSMPLVLISCANWVL